MVFNRDVLGIKANRFGSHTDDGKSWLLPHLMDERWDQLEKDQQTVGQDSRKKRPYSAIDRLQHKLVPQHPKDKDVYERAIQQHWQLWLHTQKAVVVGLCFYEKNVVEVIAKRRTIYEWTFRALCLRRVQGVLETTEHVVTDTWVDDEYYKGFSYTVKQRTDGTDMFYPTHNLSHQGWYLSEPVRVKWISYNTERRSLVRLPSNPHESVYTKSPGWEYRLDNNVLIPDTEESLISEYGEAVVLHARETGSAIIAEPESQTSVDLMNKLSRRELGAVVQRPPLIAKIRKQSKESLAKEPAQQAAPSLRYQAANGAHCTFASAASVLEYVGLTNEAKRVMELCEVYSAVPINVRKPSFWYVRDTLSKLKDTDSNKRVGPHLQTKNLNPRNFCLVDEDEQLLKLDKAVLYLLSVLDDDGINATVVSIFDGWVFDPNMPHALPYTKEALDHTTSSVFSHPSKDDTTVMRTNRATGIVTGLAIFECRPADVKNTMKSFVYGGCERGEVPAPKHGDTEQGKNAAKKRKRREKKLAAKERQRRAMEEQQQQQQQQQQRQGDKMEDDKSE